MRSLPVPLSLSNGDPGSNECCMSPIENWYDPSKRSRCCCCSSAVVELNETMCSVRFELLKPLNCKDCECYKTTFTRRAARWRGRRSRFIYINYRMRERRTWPNDMRDKIKMGTVSNFKEWINSAAIWQTKATSRWINCQLCSVCKQLR